MSLYSNFAPQNSPLYIFTLIIVQTVSEYQIASYLASVISFFMIDNWHWVITDNHFATWKSGEVTHTPSDISGQLR